MPSKKSCPHEDKLVAMAEQVREIHETLLGKPPEHVGLVVRVDRLEQSSKWRTWGMRALWATAVGAIGAHFK